jgi:hypothetical protein
MLDFNSQAEVGERFTALLDLGLTQARHGQAPRDYLGASRLGLPCERALQYEFLNAPVDPGRAPDGRLLRIFERGHVMEACMAGWLRSAGFDLRTHKANGAQFSFSALSGRLQGHIDGVLVAGPEGFAYPALWENKCVGAKSWRALVKDRLARAKPVYHAQIVLYQAYLQLHEHPALFTAVNADTMEIYTELVPFDAALAQRLSDRAVKIVSASDAAEMLPRSFQDRTHFECRFCNWQSRCWTGAV